MPPSIYLIGALLAFAGGALSLYFYGVYKEILNKKQWWIPSILHVSPESCTQIIDTHYGKHFGLSNIALGIPFMVGYGIILFATAQGNISTMIPFIMGIVSIIIGIYLIYGLVKMKMHCKVCYTIHSINLIIFFLQLSV